ncbi:MAG: ABC transporter ATP-binding protein [Granulosicoccus sp.]
MQELPKQGQRHVTIGTCPEQEVDSLMSVMPANVRPEATERVDSRAVIELQNIRKSFGSLSVLDGLSLSVQPGEVFGFLGRNGAGKSTAIRILMGITRADDGTVRLFGEPLADDVIAARQRIGYVAQEQNMYPWMTPRVLSRFVRGFYPRWDERRYRQLMDDFALPPKRRVGTFSGGMKAKLALSLALATRPDLLILDEPTAGMDPVARREFLDLVREQTTRDGATTFFSTHLIDEIEAVATRIGIVEAGRTMYEGTLHPLRDSMATWSIDARNWVEGSLPGEFAQSRLRILQEGERQGRHWMTLQFSGTAPVVQVEQLLPGWRHDIMTLEDVFIAVVSNANRVEQ